MTREDQKKETCPCRVCRSDMAYVHPCDLDGAVVEFEIIYTDAEVQQMARQAEE